MNSSQSTRTPRVEGSKGMGRVRMAGVALLAAVALLVACGPPAATNVAVAPVAPPMLVLPSPAQHPTPGPTPTPTATPTQAPTATPVVKPAPAPAPKPVYKPVPRPAVKPAPKPAQPPAPIYGTPTVSTGGCAVYSDAYVPPPQTLPAFTVRSGGRVLLTHAAHSATLTASFSGSWRTTTFEIYTGGVEDANNTNTRVGTSGSFTTGGHTYTFTGSWPLCP